MKKARFIVGSVLLVVSVVALATLYKTSINEFYSNIGTENIQQIQNAGFTHNLFPFVPYKLGSLLVVDWKDNVSALFILNATGNIQWAQVGPTWATDGTPADEACDSDSEIEGCKPEMTGSLGLFNGCPAGCGYSPYTITWTAENGVSFEVQKNYAGSWISHYSGTSTSTLGTSNGTSSSGSFRIRAVNQYGNSEWGFETLPVQCSSTQNPW